MSPSPSASSSGSPSVSYGTSTPALLLQASYCGTLAATRCLGSHGIAVTLADDDQLAPALWSRFATRTLSGPDLSRPEAVLAWLLQFAAREPRHVLHPTSDDLAWLIAVHRDELARSFDLFVPPAEAIERLLDKRRLHEAANAVGLATPPTWYPADEAELAELAQELPYPVLLKPRTQVFSSTHGKGGRVHDRSTLLEAFRAAREGTRHPAAVLARMPEASVPMVQAWQEGCAESIFTVSGFAGGGDLFCARASRKILQRPRGLGVGVCFSAAPLPDDLAERLRRLCDSVGFHGAFDVEFLEVGERLVLIDFNPRFYNQMAFEIDRGIPTPYLVWLAATGQKERLAAAVAEARAADPCLDAIYCDRLVAMHTLALQVLFGAVPPSEERRWRHWFHDHARHRTDPLGVATDRLPALVAAVAEVREALRHPRAFLRKTALGGSE